MKHQVVTLLADFPSKGAAQQAHARLSRLAVGEHRLRTRVLERVPSQHGTATTQHQRNMRFLYQGPAFMQCRHVRPDAPMPCLPCVGATLMVLQQIQVSQGDANRPGQHYAR